MFKSTFLALHAFVQYLFSFAYHYRILACCCRILFLSHLTVTQNTRLELTDLFSKGSLQTQWRGRNMTLLCNSCRGSTFSSSVEVDISYNKDWIHLIRYHFKFVYIVLKINLDNGVLFRQHGFCFNHLAKCKSNCSIKLVILGP